MSRVFVRRASVMIVIAALALVALPTADASPLAGPHSTAGRGASWISALSTWVSSLFVGAPQAGTTALHAAPSASTTTEKPTYTGPQLHPNTGTCIDPNGKPIPCGQT
jgi:hypothetical protein